MKKYRLLLLLSALLFFLGACGDKKQEKGSESKESTVHQSKDSSATSETKKAESSSDKKEKTKMDIEAIAQGDYSSVAGVWQDDKGNKLVFDQNGLVSNEYESYGLSLTGLWNCFRRSLRRSYRRIFDGIHPCRAYD